MVIQQMTLQAATLGVRVPAPSVPNTGVTLRQEDYS